MTRRLQAEQLESRICFSAGSKLIPVGSGAGYTLSINDTGRVAVMQVSQAEFNLFGGTATADVSATTLAQRTAITKRLYQFLPDVFDQVVVVANQGPTQVPTQNGGILYGVNFGVQNDTRGTGDIFFNNTATYGSTNKLQSFIALTDRTGIREGVLAHELFHRWGNHLPNVLPGFSSGGDPVHWGLSSVGGTLGGWERGTVQNLGGGFYDANGPLGSDGFAVNSNAGLLGPFPPNGGVPYAPLELYLMGLIPASQVPDIDVAINGQNLTPFTEFFGIFKASGFQTFTINDIIQKAGQRAPSVLSAQHDFRAITVLITPAAPTQAELDETDTQVELYSKQGTDADDTKYNFWEATGGRATLTLDGLESYLPGHKAGGVNDVLAVGADGQRIIGLSTVDRAGTYDVDKAIYPQIHALLQDFQGELRVVSADVNGDGVNDYIFSTGAGGVTRFGVFNGDLTGYLILPTEPFQGSEDFSGGAFVSAADLTGDNRAEIIVSADQGGGPRVTVYSLRPLGNGATVLADFLGIDDPNFRGGARTAVGDANGDGFADVSVAAGYGGGPRVALYSGFQFFTARAKLTNDFFAFAGDDATRLRNGVFLSMGDLDGDLKADLVFGGGPGGAPRVTALSGSLISTGRVTTAQAAPLANYFVDGNADDRGGVRVTVKFVDTDQRPEIVVGSGEGSRGKLTVYSGASLPTTGTPKVLQQFVLFDDVLPGGVYVG